MRLEQFFHDAKGPLTRRAQSTEAPFDASARLDFYAWLVEHDLAHALAAQYAHVKRAIDRANSNTFEEIAIAYRRVAPPCHWDIAEYTRRFPDFLRDLASLDPSLAAAAEVADFQAALHSVGAFPDGQDEPIMDKTLILRLYRHRIPRFCFDAVSSPEKGETCVVVYRSLRDRTSRWLIPSRPMLEAIGAWFGLGDEPASLPQEHVSAFEDLIELGVMARRLEEK
jgi:hypothetical protein